MSEIITYPPKLGLIGGVVACLTDATGLKWGRAAIPDGVVFTDDDKLVDGYGMVHVLPGVPTYACLDDTWESAVMVQLTSVGSNAEQAQWVADKAKQALTSRNPDMGGDWTNPITANDVRVIDRRVREDGGPEPTNGGLWQVVDTFDLEVIAQ